MVTITNQIPDNASHVNELKLIDGKFAPTEAREILTSLFRSKIRFHEMKNFTALECTGHPDQVATHRLPELKASLQKVQQLLNEMEDSDLTVTINAVVSLHFSPTEQQSQPQQQPDLVSFEL